MTAVTREIVWLYILGRVADPEQRRAVEAARATDPAVAGWFELLLGNPEREPPDEDDADVPELTGAARAALRTLRQAGHEPARREPQPVPAHAPTLAFASAAVPVEWEVAQGEATEGQFGWCVARLRRSPGLTLEITVTPAARGNGVVRVTLQDGARSAAPVHGVIDLDEAGDGSIGLDSLIGRWVGDHAANTMRVVLEPPAPIAE